MSEGSGRIRHAWRARFRRKGGPWERGGGLRNGAYLNLRENTKSEPKPPVKLIIRPRDPLRMGVEVGPKTASSCYRLKLRRRRPLGRASGAKKGSQDRSWPSWERPHDSVLRINGCPRGVGRQGWAEWGSQRWCFRGRFRIPREVFFQGFGLLPGGSTFSCILGVFLTSR